MPVAAQSVFAERDARPNIQIWSSNRPIYEPMIREQTLIIWVWWVRVWLGTIIILLEILLKRFECCEAVAVFIYDILFIIRLIHPFPPPTQRAVKVVHICVLGHSRTNVENPLFRRFYLRAGIEPASRCPVIGCWGRVCVCVCVWYDVTSVALPRWWKKRILLATRSTCQTII